MESMIGSLIFALGGLAGAVFALPFRRVKGWSYETYWLVYAVFGLILFPVFLAFMTVPECCGVFARTPGAVMVKCAGFGALWGLGGLTWGLMIRYLGIGLGLAIGCGLCSATGTLIPPIVSGEADKLVENSGAIVVLCGVFVSLLGIVFVGLAGKSKEAELPEEEKKKSVAEFNFKKGMIVAVFSGVASAGMNFGLQGGVWEVSGVKISMADVAVRSGAKECWGGMAVLVVVLFGGFLVNAAWCLWQMLKNKSTEQKPVEKAPVLGNVVFAGLAGVIWACQFACQKFGEPLVGEEMAYIGFAVVMGSSVMFSSLLGIFLGEWKGTGARTKRFLAIGIGVLLSSFIVISAGNKLKPAKTEGEKLKETREKAERAFQLDQMFPGTPLTCCQEKRDAGTSKQETSTTNSVPAKAEDNEHR